MLETRDLSYSGEFHGEGTLTFANGDIYVGEFHDGLFDGPGTYTWPDGRQFVGNFRYSDINKQALVLNSFLATGLMKWPNGARYDGEVRSGTPSGMGTLNFPDGSSATGRFSEGRFVGP